MTKNGNVVIIAALESYKDGSVVAINLRVDGSSPCPTESATKSLGNHQLTVSPGYRNN